MSKINELILKLCPNGVEYKNIKDLCLENFWVMPSTPNYQNEGIPYITSKNIRNGIVMFDDVKYITEEDYKSISNNRPISENDFLISMIGTIGEVGIVRKEDLPFYGQNMYLLRLNTNLINIKYFYHYFTSEMVRKKLLGEKNNGNQGYLKTKNIESLKVPVPPLEVQVEIIKILDKFGELEAELETELETRKSQYEFWRDKILSMYESHDMKLFDMAQVFDGTHSTPNYQLSGIPFISVENISNIYGSDKYISKEDFDKYKIKPQINDVFMTRIGSIGKCSVFDRQLDLAYYVSLALIRPNTKIILPKYLKYVIESNIGKDELYKRTLVHAVPIKVNKDEIGKIVLPVPSIDDQKKIISVLDSFESLTESITVGLPAEIELRRKQYEYYKNKLLNFEELSVSE